MDVATNGSTFELWRCFFFFQAEDGIRDLTVTGVQTCALPILVEERRADGDLRPLHQLREDRERRTPQHRERDPHEQEVVEEEARLAAHHRLELRFSREQRQARGVHREARRPRGDQEEQEKVSHIRLRERVHARNHARACNERSENREQPRPDDESEVPLLQHPALLLDHHRVEEGGHGEPRQQRRVLDRVPGPVATPPELDVGPPHPETDPDGEEQPGQEGPFADGDQPVHVEAFRQQSRHRERERDRKSTRLNSSHSQISYAVFCLKKKTTNITVQQPTILPYYPDYHSPTIAPSTASNCAKNLTHHPPLLPSHLLDFLLACMLDTMP